MMWQRDIRHHEMGCRSQKILGTNEGLSLLTGYRRAPRLWTYIAPRNQAWRCIAEGGCRERGRCDVSRQVTGGLCRHRHDILPEPRSRGNGSTVRETFGAGLLKPTADLHVVQTVRKPFHLGAAYSSAQPLSVIAFMPTRKDAPPTPTAILESTRRRTCRERRRRDLTEECPGLEMVIGKPLETVSHERPAARRGRRGISRCRRTVPNRSDRQCL